MAISVPQLPKGVRPVVGDHVARLELGRRTRQLRKAANLAAVARRRIAPHPRLPEPAVYPKVFVVGCPRSGTSWIQSMFEVQPDVITSSESHAYETIYEPVVARGRGSIEAWTKVLHRHDLSEREARWVGLHWWVNRATMLDLIGWAFDARGVDSEAAAERVIQGVFDSYFVERGGDARSTLLEKTPGHLQYAARILRRYPEARVVEVVRDGRDVCVSLQMQALTTAWPPTDRREQIALWVRAMRLGDELHRDRAIADRVLRVRYEDAKADPASTIARLLEFAQLPASRDAVAATADVTDFRHRDLTGPGRHTRRGVVGDWRNHFDADDETLFRELGGDTLLAAGYEL